MMVKVFSWLRNLVGDSADDTIPLPGKSPEQLDENHVDLNISSRLTVDAGLATHPLHLGANPDIASQWVYDLGWASHTGLVRDHNEDAIYVLMGHQEADQSAPAFGLFMVADGMGGHHGGERASMLALRTASACLIEEIYVPLLAGKSRGADQPSITDLMRAAIQKANTEVAHAIPGSGCTLTFGMVIEERVYIGHVGDSRAYRFRPDASVDQLTTDHSFVNRLIEMGELTPEEAEYHPQRNVLYRAIGQAGSIEAEVIPVSMVTGDIFVLCSDGLWNMVSDDVISDILQNAGTLQTACHQLVSQANAEGGTDNISVIAFRLHS